MCAHIFFTNGIDASPLGCGILNLWKKDYFILKTIFRYFEPLLILFIFKKEKKIKKKSYVTFYVKTTSM